MALSGTPQFWMHLQANFDLKAAMVRRRTLKLAKKPWAIAAARFGLPWCNPVQGATATLAFTALLA